MFYNYDNKLVNLLASIYIYKVLIKLMRHVLIMSYEKSS